MKDGVLEAIDEKPYVLTLDYTIKMLNIHERRQCGMPVILEGETGVGKTALIEMLSDLWMQSLIINFSKIKSSLIQHIHSELKKINNEEVSCLLILFERIIINVFMGIASIGEIE